MARAPRSSKTAASTDNIIDAVDDSEPLITVPTNVSLPHELAGLISEIDSKQGGGITFTANSVPPRPHCPTGVFLLDLALLGGVPEGLATMVYGKESSGKSMLCAMIVANFQRKYPEKWAFWVDMEQTFDPSWAKKLGVNLKRLQVAQPTTGENGVDILVGAISTLEVGIVVGDSIPAFVPRRIQEKSADEDTRAELARLVSKLCAKALGAMAEERVRGHYVTQLYVNQQRDAMIGNMPFATKLPGGRNQHYFVTTKIKMKNEEIMIKGGRSGEVPDYNRHSFEIEKAKIGASIRKGEFEVVINETNPRHAGLKQGQVNDVETAVTYAKKFGLVTGGGSKWSISTVQGQTFKKAEEVVEFMKENPRALLATKQQIIRMQREETGILSIPPDGFLLDWIKRGPRR